MYALPSERPGALPFQFKKKPFAHQLDCFERSKDAEYFAILFEMGAGKSKVVVDNAAYLHSHGRINGLLVIAPNGVHTKWLKEDFPLSWPEWAEMKGAVWHSGSKKSYRECEALLEPGQHLRVLCMNVEAFSHKSGLEFAKRFLRATDAMMVVDESQRIKNPTAIRTKNITSLRSLAKYRRILSGTPILNSPFDYYAQFNFLDPQIFGQSFFAFKAEYAEIASADDPLVQAIMRKQGLRVAPMLVRRDAQGREMYKNLDKLKRIIAPCSMRVTKDECLDLPPKIYETRYFQLEPAQWKMYEELRTKMKSQFEDTQLHVMHKMTLLMRLQQVANGYFPGDEGGLRRIYPNPKDNPRIRALLDTLEDIDGKVIIWCRFVDEIKDIMSVLGNEAVAYYGAVSTGDRAANLDAFQQGDKRFFVGNAVVGGTGLNLTQSATVVYYSNTFSYGDRQQSEDRAHRIGQTADKVVYVDLEAENTVDHKIVKSLRNKQDVANYLTNFKDV